MLAAMRPPLAASQSPLNSVSLAVTSSVSLVPALRPELTHSAAPALPTARGAAGAPMRKLRSLPLLRLSPRDPLRWAHAGTPFVLDKKRMGRTRKGYAASVSGTAANGCAMDGPREKIASAGRSAQARTSMPPAEDGWPFRVLDWIKRVPLGKPSARGGPGYISLLFPLALPRYFAGLPAGAGLAVNAGRRGRRPLQGDRGNPVNGRPIYHPVGADAHIRPPCQASINC